MILETIILSSAVGTLGGMVIGHGIAEVDGKKKLDVKSGYRKASESPIFKLITHSLTAGIACYATTKTLAAIEHQKNEFSKDLFDFACEKLDDKTTDIINEKYDKIITDVNKLRETGTVDGDAISRLRAISLSTIDVSELGDAIYDIAARETRAEIADKQIDMARGLIAGDKTILKEVIEADVKNYNVVEEIN